jgi:hypothetical protein
MRLNRPTSLPFFPHHPRPSNPTTHNTKPRINQPLTHRAHQSSPHSTARAPPTTTSTPTRTTRSQAIPSTTITAIIANLQSTGRAAPTCHRSPPYHPHIPSPPPHSPLPPAATTPPNGHLEKPKTKPSPTASWTPTPKTTTLLSPPTNRTQTCPPHGVHA